MAQSKFSENLIRLKCSQCKRVNYYTRKNRKTVEKKLEYKNIAVGAKSILFIKKERNNLFSY